MYEKQKQAIQMAGTEEEKAKLDAIKRRMAAQGIGDSGINMAEQRLASNEVSKEVAAKTGAVDIQQLQAQQDIDTQNRTIAAQKELATMSEQSAAQLEGMREQAATGQITLENQLQTTAMLNKTTADAYYQQGLAGTKLDEATLADLKTSNPLGYQSYLDGQAGKTVQDHNADVTNFNSKQAALITAEDYKTDPNFTTNLQTIYNMKPGDTLVNRGGIMTIQSTTAAGTPPLPTKTFSVPKGVNQADIDSGKFTFDPNTGTVTMNETALQAFGGGAVGQLGSSLTLPTGQIIPAGTNAKSYPMIDASGQVLFKNITDTGITYYTDNKTGQLLQSTLTDNGLVFVPWQGQTVYGQQQ
jgi:hypothetical protein